TVRRRAEPAGLRRVRRLVRGAARHRARRGRLVPRRPRPRRRLPPRAGSTLGIRPAPPGRSAGHVRHRAPTSVAELMTRIVVDGMNVIGSRADGWWRDRDGAARRLLRRLQRALTHTDDVLTLVLEGPPLSDVGEE